MKCKFYFTALYLLWGGFFLAASPAINVDKAKEYSKTITESFPIASNGVVVISNRYGDIDIETTSGNNVEFEIVITVEAGNDDRADGIMDRIDVSFNNSSQRVEATTEISDKKGWKWKKNNEYYQIDYKVLLPKSNRVEVTNKYGDIALASLENGATIDLKYGNGNLQDINGDLELKLGYVKSFQFGRVSGDLEIGASYSGVNGESASDTKINSKYSNYEFDELADVEIQSAYDEFEIGRAGSVTNGGKYDELTIDYVDIVEIKTRYSKIRIGQLGSTARFETGYGSVTINEMAKGFKSVDIESRYTGYEIDIDQAFDLDIETEYVGVSVPDDMTFSERIKDNSTQVMRGHYRASGGGKISAVMHYGQLKLDD